MIKILWMTLFLVFAQGEASATCLTTLAEQSLSGYLESLDPRYIPISIDGQSGCLRLSTDLDIEVKKVSKDAVEFELSKLGGDYINVSAPQEIMFLWVENSLPKNSTLSVISYICSGEHPLWADTFSEEFEVLSKKQVDDSKSERIFIRSGKPGESIGVPDKIKQNARIYDQFLDIYEQKAGEDLREGNPRNIYLPGMLQSSINDLNKRLYSDFLMKTGSSLNACSKRFQNVMKELNAEVMSNEKNPSEIELTKKKDSSKFRLSWFPKSK
jgi:hypothetical protein